MHELFLSLIMFYLLFKKNKGFFGLLDRFVAFDLILFNNILRHSLSIIKTLYLQDVQTIKFVIFNVNNCLWYYY